MKLLPLSLLVALLSLSAHATLVGSPFPPVDDARFNAIETGTGLASSSIQTAAIASGAVTESKEAVPNGVALYVHRIARATWDPTGTSAHRSVGAHTLGVTLPAKAIITHSYFYTKTSLVSTNNDGTIAFSCATANDIFSAADIDASSGVAGQIGAGVSVGTAATMKLADACTLTATVAVDAFTAGKIDLFVEYVIAE